jgi:hypothetical protein
MRRDAGGRGAASREARRSLAAAFGTPICFSARLRRRSFESVSRWRKGEARRRGRIDHQSLQEVSHASPPKRVLFTPSRTSGARTRDVHPDSEKSMGYQLPPEGRLSVKVREFARLVGVSHPAVLKGVANARLSRSVRRDARGRVVEIDRELGLREWEGNRTRLSPDVLSGKRSARRASPPASAPALVFGGLDALDRPGAAFVGVRIDLGPFLAGVAEALREQGREPTPDELRAVVSGCGDVEWWALVIDALNDSINPAVSVEDRAELWRLAGRDAVFGEEGTNGSEG